jgi:hypothetical protein
MLLDHSRTSVSRSHSHVPVCASCSARSSATWPGRSGSVIDPRARRPAPWLCPGRRCDRCRVVCFGLMRTSGSVTAAEPVHLSAREEAHPIVRSRSLRTKSRRANGSSADARCRADASRTLAGRRRWGLAHIRSLWLCKAVNATRCAERTRTSTDQVVHKALNPIRPPLMGPPASESSISSAFLDASDASGGATFVRLLSRTGLWDGDLDGNDCCGRRGGSSRPAPPKGSF